MGEVESEGRHCLHFRKTVKSNTEKKKAEYYRPEKLKASEHKYIKILKQCCCGLKDKCVENSEFTRYFILF